MDFTFAEVRDYVFSAAEELVDRFDVDGLELCFRDHALFPSGTGRQSQPLMTELVGRVSGMLRKASAARGRKLVLGTRFYDSLQECHDQGLNVPTWIGEGLVDYVSPQDVLYTAVNARFEEFAELTRATECLLYPTLLPWTSVRARRRLADHPMPLDKQRAAARNWYGAGTDGLSFYNHSMTIRWAPFYPMMLFEMDELRDPERVAQGRRHYVFEPVLAGKKIFGESRASTGRVKADGMVVTRGTPRQFGKYRFRMCEDLGQVRRASLLFRGYHMTDGDEVEVRLNGTEIRPPP